MRHAVGECAEQADQQTAPTSRIGRFETETLSANRNITVLMNLSGEWIDKSHQRQPLKQLTLDHGSSISKTNEKQERTACDGHFECSCYQPLFLLNQFGDLRTSDAQTRLSRLAENHKACMIQPK